MFSLTKRQADLLDFIKSEIAKTGMAPTLDDMRTAAGLASKSGVHRALTALEQRGHIRRLKHHSRAIEVL